MEATTPAADKFTLDDLVALWESEPAKYKATLFVYYPQTTPTGGIVSGAAGETAGPINGLTNPVDLDWLWRELVMRNGDTPGTLVCRLLPAPGAPGEKSRTVSVVIGEGAIRRWGTPKGRAPDTVTMNAPAAPSAPAPPPPTDLVTALTGMMMTMMTTLMKSATDKGPDPYVQMLIRENQALQEKYAASVKEPARLEKSQFQEAMELGGKLAENNSSGMALLAEPIGGLSRSIEKAVSERSTTERIKAEADKERAEAEHVKAQIELLEKQLAAADRGVLELSAEDRAKAEAAMAEVRAEAAKAQVNIAKNAAAA